MIDPSRSRKFSTGLASLLANLALIGIAAIAFTRYARLDRVYLNPAEMDAYRRPQTLPRRAISPLFDPAEASRLLDAPTRNRWQKPAQIVQALGLRPGDAVADIGAGSGYLMRYLSRAVGPAGNVYEEEIQAAYLPELHRRARPLGNVQVLLGTADDPRLPRASVDCLMLLTVYHEVQRPVQFLRTLRACARPNGRLAIIDFDATRRGDPPAPDGHWVAETAVLEEARAAGWELCARHNFISSQFFLVFRPAGKPND